MAGVFDVTHDFAQLFHPSDVQVSGGVGQGRGADLDDDSHTDSSRVKKKFDTLHTYPILLIKKRKEAGL